MVSYAAGVDVGVPDIVRAAWDRVDAAWDDTASHEELLRLTTLHACHAWVVGRYRNVDAERAAFAARRIEALQKAAEIAMMSGALPRQGERTPYRSSLIALVVIAMLIVVGVTYASYVKATGHVNPNKRSTRPAPSAPVAPVRR